MPEAFSFNREFDFVRLDGLRRATGRPAHEWDLYILKELIDNALDADDALWHTDRTRVPQIQVRVEYLRVPARKSQQLFVQVGNRALFPVGQIDAIFATQRYTSRKAFFKGLSRGALGNALKTLLGIPYALRNRVAGDWNPELKPFAILCQGNEYLPGYTIDSTGQAISFACEVRAGKKLDGTLISVGVDHFEQEQPRTIGQIELLAQQYHLCNPHVHFIWSVEIGGQEWTSAYAGDPAWAGKFSGVTPVQWYSPTAFRDLLGALHREHCQDDSGCQLPIERVCRCFAGFSGPERRPAKAALQHISADCGASHLTRDDIEGPAASRLHQALCRASSRFDSASLGRLGPEHVRACLAQALPLDADALYDSCIDAGDDPSVPFVLEAAVARLREGKRQIWTAINFAPTYDEPFRSRWLHAAARPDDPALGLRGLLDAYGLTEEQPVVLFLHLICPNVEHHEFSKTEINHLPFKQALGELLDRLLGALVRAEEEQALRLERTVFAALDAILGELDPQERFVFEQLLERLQRRLSQDAALAAWQGRPESPARLQAYIASYQARTSEIVQHVARAAAGTLSLPLHPDRHLSLRAEHVSRELLTHYHVDKLLYVQARELEPVVIENDWLCRLDAALLHNPPGADGLQEALVRCVAASDLPILALHDADERGQANVEQLRTWLRERRLDEDRIIDVGLATRPDEGEHPTRLIQMMPGELFAWLHERLATLGIAAKSLPPDPDIRQAIRERFDRLLRGHLWEGVSQQLAIARLLDDIDRRLDLAGTMKGEALDQQLKRRLTQEAPRKTYAVVLDEVVEAFFEAIMRGHSAEIHDIVRQHLDRVRKDQEP
jgi:hypothetical protein